MPPGPEDADGLTFGRIFADFLHSVFSEKTPEEDIKKEESNIIELQIWPKYFDAVVSGDKTFEVRERRNRDFKVGSILVLRCYDPEAGYDGRVTERVVTYILEDRSFCLPGHVIMAIKEIL